ncbi:MAG: sensor domain-containing diguanylate cyclase [Rhodoferax sp.]|uniref:sensor domain-containing diguanylate cyclase n=1 Tax=Rhodoferax sp. TaxID=50421 RepID=UPI002722593F|nr:sensor domain-containing diguanylate cyclase [Rhodoferax sp.]MDO8448325.1 sensor domain-containing diguanylate cyclase [Rhodoferax sp.]
MTQPYEPLGHLGDDIDSPLSGQPSVVFLRYCIAALVVGTIAVVLVLYLAAPHQTGRAFAPLLLLLVAATAWYLIGRGRTRAAILVMAVGAWTAMTGTAVFTGGVQAPAVIAYPVIILMTGWLISSRAALVVTGLTVTATLGLVWAEARGFLPMPVPSPAAIHGGEQVVVYIASGILAFFLVRVYRRRLEELHKLSRDLTLRTRDLEASREELCQAQAALQGSEGRYRTMIEWSPESILVHRQGKILYVNPAAVRMFGAVDASGLLAKFTSELIHPDFLEVQTARMKSIIANVPITPMVESRFLRLDGTPIDVEVQGTSIVYDGEPAIHVCIRNITERKQMQDQVRQLAFYDTLTKLPNRRLLNDRLSQALAASKRTACYGALMFLDLDKLKPLNDTHGHDVGDLLLIDVAERLRHCVRERDTVARFGGDEFVVMLAELDADKTESASQAALIAEKIREILAEPYVLAGRPAGNAAASVRFHCTASIGVALFVSHESSQEEVLMRADAAMYQAKKVGGNRVHFHDSMA